jgi:hypothetical protein
MFAGLPGIGVGTLFYVLTALWMPFRELIAVVRRQSCVARWQLVASQFCFAISIVASVGVADRVLALLLGGQKITSISPARLINESFAAQAPASLWAAPIVASLLLLAGVMAVVEVLRLWVCFRARRSDRQGYAGTGQPTAMILQGDKR